jgi:formylmethanofuran dehydrogenase subunit E
MGYVEFNNNVLGDENDLRENITMLICQLCNEIVAAHEYGYDGHQWACKRCKAVNG